MIGLLVALITQPFTADFRAEEPTMVQFVEDDYTMSYLVSEGAQDVDSELGSVAPYYEKSAPGVIIYFEEPEIIEVAEKEETWSGPILTQSMGRNYNGPSGEETYYNLKMGKVIDNMRSYGYSVEEYPYWVRSDGVKMLGDYVMIAADHDIRPIGTKVMTSLGMGIVCDTGAFANGKTTTQIDIAVTW